MVNPVTNFAHLKHNLGRFEVAQCESQGNDFTPQGREKVDSPTPCWSRPHRGDGTNTESGS